MKKVGIIFAMQEELVEIKNILKIDNVHKIYELEIYEGKINKINYFLVESGVGKVNSARTTQILIGKYSVDCIINVGVAGGISNTLNVGDIVIGTKLIQHDFDITAFNHKKGYIPKVGDYIDSDKYLIECAEVASKDIDNINICKGTIASGDIFCTEEKMAQKINTKFNALCTEMEGASIAQVCYLCNVPFIVLRSISDVPNNNNVITYEQFLPKACKNISVLIYNMLTIIK